MSFGYVKLHKRARDSRVFSDDRAWKLFTYCLMSANHSPGYFEGMTIERGQFATSLRNLAEDLGWTVSATRTALGKCSEYGCIRVDNARKFSIVTVENYEAYNCSDDDLRTATAQYQHSDGAQSARESHANHTQIATIEEQQEEQEQQEEKGRSDKRPEPPSRKKKWVYSERDMKGAVWMLGELLKIQPNRKKPQLEFWANTFRLMREEDNRAYEDIFKLFKWAQDHHFWGRVITTPEKLRRKWDDLELEWQGASKPKPVKPKPNVDAVYSKFEKPE